MKINTTFKCEELKNLFIKVSAAVISAENDSSRRRHIWHKRMQTLRTTSEAWRRKSRVRRKEVKKLKKKTLMEKQCSFYLHQCLRNVCYKKKGLNYS